MGDSTTVYEQQLLLALKGATQPGVIPTQTATTVISATPSPTVSQMATATVTAAVPTGHNGSIVVFLIISVAIVIAGVGTSLGAKPAP